MRSTTRLTLLALAALGARASAADLAPTCCPVLELRQYTLKPGQRDVLVDLFEREFVESQEALGMRVAGTFRDASRPDRFVWLRGFEDMGSRLEGLTAFYGGPAWKAHRQAANATMIDSDDVLLLRPAREGAGLDVSGARAAVGAPAGRARTIVATVHSFASPVDRAFADWFAFEAVPRLTRSGAVVLGLFVTEPAPNTFPALPVREGENVFVWFAAYEDRAAAAASLDSLPGWRERVAPRLRDGAKGDAVRVVLEPTARSRVR